MGLFLFCLQATMVLAPTFICELDYEASTDDLRLPTHTDQNKLQGALVSSILTLEHASRHVITKALKFTANTGSQID